MGKRFCIAIFAALWLAACATAPGEDAVRQRLRAAQLRLPDEAAQAEALARQTLAEAQSASIERSATHLLADALAAQGQCDALRPQAEREAAAPDAGAYAWRFVLALAYECEDYERASELLSELHRRYPDDIAGMSPDMMFRIAPRSNDAALLAFVVGGGWRPEDPAVDMSGLRLALIRAHLANGDGAAAQTAARELMENGRSDLAALVVLLSDRTYAPVIEADPMQFDFRRMADRFVENAFATYTAHPDRLSVLNALAVTLRDVGRPGEALALVDDALSRSAEFADRDTALNWIYQTRAELRLQLGREEEALDDLTAGARESEDGRDNVSQRLNRAGLLLDRGQAEQALAEAEAVDPTHLSPYGRAVRRYFMVCANAELGRTEAMRAALEAAIAHGADSYMQLQATAQCANDLDLAAQAFIRRLNDPMERRSAILEVQGFAGEPAPRDWQGRHPLYSRPDVRAAIDAATSVRVYPIRRQYF